jgi:hypothetical protein
MSQEEKEENYKNINSNIFNSEEQRVKSPGNFQLKQLKFESQNKHHSVKNCFSLSFLKKHKKIAIPIAISIILAIIILIAAIFLFLKNKNGKDNISEKEHIIDNPIEPANNIEYKIKNEFNILTKIGDLRSISVTQISKEETKMNSDIISSKITRKTNYDIYFKSEEEATEENQKYYSKMYKGIVSIRSECTTAEGDDCQPQPLVDLRSKSRNIRLLNSEDFKDIPIALCIFNITDNNVITTLICPESLSDIKRNEIILDLYFFRPPAAERADKVNDNITLIIVKDEDTNKTFIHETNGGYCNIYNNWCSECTTDMNTTVDSEYNILTYEEVAFMSLKKNEKIIIKKIKLQN